MAYVPLSQGYEAQVDDEDYEKVSQYKWHAQVVPTRKGTRVYAATNLYVHGRRQTRYLHQILAGNRVVGFVDGDSLNCRRENITDKSKGSVRTFCINCAALLANRPRLRLKQEQDKLSQEPDRFFCDEACLTVYLVARAEDADVLRGL